MRRTSRDLNSCPSPPSPLRQNLDKNQNLDKQVNSNVNKEFLPKNLPNNPPKKILPKIKIDSLYRTWRPKTLSGFFLENVNNLDFGIINKKNESL